MGKTLLPDGKGYKANFHCHSTQSDGILTPEQLKKYYMEHGYSILAYTDHFFMCDRSYLCDENFIAISGYENEVVNNNTQGVERKVYHLNFYSPKPDKVGMVGITEGPYKWWMARLKEEEAKKTSLLNGFSKDEYSIDSINNMIKEAHDAGYLVVYNHPVWSGQIGKEYLGLKGLCGMEIVNYGCVVEGYEEENSYIYDQMLREGQKINCFANDDNHNGFIVNPNCPNDSFGGYNIMYPEKFTYEGVFDAMKKGRGYASTGGVLRGIRIEDGKIYVGAEDARLIRLTTNGRCSRIVMAKEKPLVEACFDIPLDNIKYFRITVENSLGKKAFSKAYFKEDWE